MRFEYLCNQPKHLEQLVQWHVDEWAWLDPAMTYASMLEEYSTHQNQVAIPTTILALEDDDALLGSVSLLANDHQKIRAYSPWLASLYVRSDVRGRGLGKSLVERCLIDARQLQIPRLHLYTHTHVSYYEGLGWRLIDKVGFREFTAHVMAIDLASYL
jgi:N-acetylglutamate synthase-like GNAT family acetyltransferase